PITRVIFSPDGQTVVSLGGNEREGKLVFWDLHLKNAKLRPTRCTNSSTLVFTPDSATLIEQAAPNELSLWDVASASPKRYQVPEGWVCLNISPDGTTLGLLRTTTGDVLVWDLATKQERYSFRLLAQGDNTFRMAVSPGARRVAVEVNQNQSGKVGFF